MKLLARQKSSGLLFNTKHSYLQTLSEWLFCMLLIVCSYSVYFKQSQIASAALEFSLICVSLILLLCIWHRQNRMPIDKKSVLAGIVLSLVSLIILLTVFIVHTDKTEMSYLAQKVALLSVIMPLCFFFMSAVGYVYTAEVFLKKFVDCVFLISVVGLPLWFLDNVGFSLPSVPVEYEWGGAQSHAGIFGIVFPQQLADVPFITGTWYRFTLFFVEASSANFLLLVALMVELFVKQRPRAYVVVVLTIANFCVLSTLSMAFTPLVLVGWAMQSQSIHRLMRKNTIITFLFYLAITISLFALPYWVINNVSGKTNIASKNAHFSDIQAGIDAFLSQPIFGLGIQSGATEGFNSGRTGQTSGLLNTAAQGGILLLLLYLVPLGIALYRSIKVSYWGFAFFTITIGLFFFTALIENNPLLLVMLALCMVQPIRKQDTIEHLRQLSSLPGQSTRGARARTSSSKNLNNQAARTFAE